jgi:Transposase DDE domain
MPSIRQSCGPPTCSRRKRGNQEKQALGRSRGGFSTKIHLRTNAKGNPLTFDLTGGEVHETQGFDALMELHDAQPAKLLGDKGYDSDEIRDDLAKRGIEPDNAKRIRPRSRQAAKSHRAVCEPPQAVPPHRDPLRKNRQGLRLNAMYCSRKALDQNRQHGLGSKPN